MSTDRSSRRAVAGETASLPVTPVGVDVGEKTLVAAATPTTLPADAFTIDGEHLRESFKLLTDATKTLQDAGFDTATGEAQLHAAVYQRLRAQIIDAAVRTIRWIRSIPGAVLVLEEFSHVERPLWESRTDYITHFGTWLVPVLQTVLVERAHEAGIPTAYVSPAGTSRECHRCARRGEREGRTLRCTNPDCPVVDVDADRSAAVTIATRAIESHAP